MTAVEEPNADEEAQAVVRNPKDRGEFYDEWDKFAKAEKAAEDDEAKEAEEKRQRQSMENLMPSKGSSLGYEFRKGKKVQFPDITGREGEGDDETAWRVACERKQAGTESFREGTVWGAQVAVDAWAQGLLACTRIRNLRKHRAKKVADDARKELIASLANTSNEAPVDGAEKELDFSCAEAWEQMGWTGKAAEQRPLEEDLPAPAREQVVKTIGMAVENLKKAQTGPADEEVEALVCTIQMNLAQGLIKLGQFENAVGHCDAAIAMDPTNVKALWRKAKAVWGTRNPGLSREALDALLKVDPTNPAAREMLSEIEVEEARRRKKRTGVVIKPTFRFPKTKPAIDSLFQPEADEADEQEEAAQEPCDDDEGDNVDEAAGLPERETVSARSENAPLTPPNQGVTARPATAAAGWACCRRKRKTA